VGTNYQFLPGEVSRYVENLFMGVRGSVSEESDSFGIVLILVIVAVLAAPPVFRLGKRLYQKAKKKSGKTE